MHELPACLDTALVGGVVVWLAGHAHLSCINLRQWITIGVDIHSFIDTATGQGPCRCSAALAIV
jgi:hypothetical protein